jgi:hypothetical protein
MLTVKFYSEISGQSCNIFECDQVYVNVNPDNAAVADVSVMRDGRQSHLIEVSTDSGYHWSIAYVENAAGKTIETIRPPQPKQQLHVA